MSIVLAILSKYGWVSSGDGLGGGVGCGGFWLNVWSILVLIEIRIRIKTIWSKAKSHKYLPYFAKILLVWFAHIQTVIVYCLLCAVHWTDKFLTDRVS